MNSNNRKNIKYIFSLFIIFIVLFCAACGHKNYKVTTYIDGKVYQTKRVEANNKLSLPNAPEKEGYTFVGWYYGDQKLADNTRITKDLKLEARYTKNTYTIIFDDGFNDENEVKVKYKELVAMPSEPTRENYIFAGWYLGNEKFDFNRKITSNIKLKAKWDRIVADYKVEHFLMHKDGTYSNAPDEVETLKGNAGSTLEVEVKNYKGYSSPKSKEITINKDGSTVIKYYYTINKYTLTLVGDKGVENTNGSGSYFYGDNINLSYTLKDGYSFGGYDNNVNNNSFVMPDSDITIKVNTKANSNTKYLVKHYKMNIDGTYASPLIEEKTGTTDDSVTPKVENYTGFTSPKEKTVNINGDGSTIVEYFYKRNKYSLNIEKDKGIKETTGTGEYYYEEKVNISAILKDGYSFVGWSNNENDLEFTHQIGAENETIKANTTVNTYNISYNLNGGTLENQVNSYTVESNDFNLETPKKAGYKFTGWLVNGEKSDGIIKEGTFGDLNVEATYEANDDTKYKIEYYFMDVTGQNYVKNDEMTEEKKGTTDTIINFTPKDVSGFKSPILKDKNETLVDSNTLTIAGDGSTILKYYYERKKYDLTISYVNTLDNNDTEGIKQISNSGNYYYEEEVKLNVEVEEGFEFEKWSNGKTDQNITYKMTSDDNQTLIANIKRKEYNVNFDSKSGSTVKGTTALYGKTVEKPTDPTRAGYDFVGWYYKENEEEKQWNFETDTMPHNNVNLYAKWNIHKNTVVFDANGGTFNNEKTELDVLNQEQGSTITKIDAEPTKLGYTFVGWYKTQDGQEEWQFESDKMPDEALYLYAKWKANTYYIEYEGNTSTSGNTEKTTCIYNQDCQLNTNGFKKEYTVTYNSGYGKNNENNTQKVEYKFVNWTEGNNTYNDEQTVSNLTTENKATVTLSANWQINEETTPLKEVTRTGYTFTGWYNNETKQDNLNDVSTNLNLTAHWDANKYQVKYDANQGNGSTEPTGTITNTEHTYDKKDNLSEDKYSRDGYQFLGWSKTQHTESVDKCDDCITEADNLTAINNDEITLYATWKANTYNITYNGSTKTSGSMDSTICTFDKECQLKDNTFTREYIVTYDKNDKARVTNDTQKVEYDFKDWKNGDNTYNNQAKVKNLTSEENGKITLNAEWQVDESTTQLKNAERTGYDFDGWFNSDQHIDNLNTISKDLTLKAHWTPITYTIVFDGNGGTKDGQEQITVQATYDKEVKALEAFTKSYTLTYDYDSDDNKVDKTQSKNATFNNWKLNEKTYQTGDSLKNLTTTKGEIVTLTAQYTDPKFTIEEDNPSKNSTENYYTYEFKDWTNDGVDYKKGGTLTLNKDITLTAEYLKVIDPDKYIEEKIQKKEREDFTTTNTNHNYTIDIVKVNEPILNALDINKIETILATNEVKDVKFASGNSSVTIINETSVEAKTKEFLSKVTNTTADNLEMEKHLSSLYKKNLSITVDFDNEFAHTKDNKNSITYNLTYTNTNNNIIELSDLQSTFTTSLKNINSHKTTHYETIVGSSNKITLKYVDPTACVIAGECNIMGLFGSTPGGLKGSGIQTALSNLLKNQNIESFDILFAGMAPVNVTQTQIDNKLSFGQTLMDPFKKAFGYNGDLFAMPNSTLENKEVTVKFNPPEDKTFEDGLGTYIITFAPAK